MPTLTSSRSAYSATVADCAPATTPSSGTSYADDFAAFQRVYRPASRQFRNGQNPLTETYQTTNAISPSPHIDFDALYMDGIAFGVELEFEAGDTYDAGEWDYDEDENTSTSLGEAFYERGWTPTSRQEGYHARAGQTYRSHQGGWRFEYDGSVSGGEMISPVMQDTPETWATVHEVIKTIKSHGGVAHSRAVGSHVHVDTTAISGDVTKFARLFRLFAVFEDVLFRLAADPHRTGYQRGGGYCTPNRFPYESVSNANSGLMLSDVVRAHGSHASALCTSAVTSYGVGHVEFRLWDGSLDAAVVQAQIKLSVAMVAAAANENLDAVLDTLAPEPSGTHRNQRTENGQSAHRSLSSEEWEADTKRFRILLDALFTRTSDKDQIITLFAMNKWSFPRGNR